MFKNYSKGKVIFVGAGCGDPELLTIKALRHLQNAEIVLTDRLVSPTILEKYVSPKAKIITVGKQACKENSTPQSSINELLLEYAEQGKTIVRLKGGDISIFSNILSELETLKKYGISYELVPGITAALGAAAYTGIPLTARNHSQGVRLLSFYNKPDFEAYDFYDLAQTNDTLVFYMTSEWTWALLANLKKAVISQSKRVAVIEQATTPSQKVHIATLRNYEILPKSFASPSIVIVGSVVELHHDFAWLPNAEKSANYFAPLGKSVSQSQKISTPVSSRTTSVVGRP